MSEDQKIDTEKPGWAGLVPLPETPRGFIATGLANGMVHVEECAVRHSRDYRAFEFYSVAQPEFIYGYRFSDSGSMQRIVADILAPTREEALRRFVKAKTQEIERAVEERIRLEEDITKRQKYVEAAEAMLQATEAAR